MKTLDPGFRRDDGLFRPFPGHRKLKARIQLGIAALLAALLAACTTQPVRAPLPDTAAEALQQQRETALAPDGDWALHGRVAVSSAGDGGNARIEWLQRGHDFDVWLRAPVTRQSWRLLRQGRQVRLEGLKGGPRVGSDAQELLFDATRWILPIDAMASWVRGLRANPGQATGLHYSADGRLLGFMEDGWTIQYDRWAPGDPHHALPTRLSAQRDQARVKLVVDAWMVEPVTP